MDTVAPGSPSRSTCSTISTTATGRVDKGLSKRQASSMSCGQSALSSKGTGGEEVSSAAVAGTSGIIATGDRTAVTKDGPHTDSSDDKHSIGLSSMEGS